MKASLWLTLAAFLGALGAPAAVAAGLFGIKYGWFPYATSALLIERLAFPAAIAGAVFGFFAFVFELLARRGRALWPLLASAIGAGSALVLSMQAAYAAKFPPVHDVATNWSDPVTPSAKLVQARGADAEPVLAHPVVESDGLFAGQPVAEVNARTCAAAVPITLMGTPAAAYDKALKAVRERGLLTVTEDKPGGVIEATSTNFWNMKEDVIVRVRPEGAGARVDIRSLGRHGGTDRGHNCRRVSQLRAAIAAG